VFAELGFPAAIFKPGMGNTIAGLFLGVLSLSIGFSLAAFLTNRAIQKVSGLLLPHQDNIPWIAFASLCFLDFFFIVCGVGVLWFVWRIRMLRVFVCPNGFVVWNRSKLDVFRWDGIVNVEEISADEHDPLCKLRNFVIHRSDGEKFEFGPNKLQKSKQLAALIRSRINPAVPWYGDLVVEGPKIEQEEGKKGWRTILLGTVLIAIAITIIVLITIMSHADPDAWKYAGIAAPLLAIGIATVVRGVTNLRLVRNPKPRSGEKDRNKKRK
jgi:hypothetical protein